MINNLNLITDTEAAAAIQAEIVDGEKLLWAGTARRGPLLTKKSLLNLPLYVLVYAFFCYFFVFSQGGPHINTWVIVFIALSVGLPVINFIRWRNQPKPMYGITKSKIILKTADNFDMYDISELSEIAIVNHKNGTGSIVLGPNELKFYMLPGMYRLQGNYVPPPRLDHINNATEVYNLLLNLNADIKGTEDNYVWY